MENSSAAKMALFIVCGTLLIDYFVAKGRLVAVYDKNNSGGGDKPEDNLDDMVKAGRDVPSENDAAAKAAQRRIAARERLEAKIAEDAAAERRRRRNIILIITAFIAIIALIVGTVLIVNKVKDDKAREAAAEAAKWAKCEWAPETEDFDMVKKAKSDSDALEEQWKQFKEQQWEQLSDADKADAQKKYDEAKNRITVAMDYAPTQMELLKSKTRTVEPPRNGYYPRTGYDITVLDTSAGKLHIKLVHRYAACNDAAFKKLIKAKYFDNTECHRLSVSDGLNVVQCGDPTATGLGGPGFNSQDESPTFLMAASGGEMGGQSAVIYPKGTVAVANRGPNTGSSQFFIVLKDSQLPPNYSVIGQVDPSDFPVLDRIKKYDILVAPGSVAPADEKPVEDGVPATPITIKSWTITATKGVAKPKAKKD